VAQGILALLFLCIPFVRGYIKRYNVHGSGSCDCKCHKNAGVLKLADEHGSNPCGLNPVRVQVPPPAPVKDRDNGQDRTV
jgi:hypothetical protein